MLLYRTVLLYPWGYEVYSIHEYMEERQFDFSDHPTENSKDGLVIMGIVQFAVKSLCRMFLRIVNYFLVDGLNCMLVGMI